jgi:long-chain acyl-CoA synthetase
VTAETDKLVHRAAGSSVAGLFLTRARLHPDRPALMERDRRLTYADVGSRVAALAGWLQRGGIGRGDRVAILSENRPEWAITDFACLAARCTDVPIYPTLPTRQVEYILRDSGAAAVLVSSTNQLEKIQAIRDHLPALRHVVAFDPDATAPNVVPFDDLLTCGRAATARHPDWQAHALTAGPDDLATLIYTSGTTGDPKGVMLTHGNIASNVTTCVGLFRFVEGDECLSFLPLSHIFERMFGHYSMFYAGVVINYAGGIDTVAADMQDRRPTMMA